jgi:SSS family transporter
MDPSQLNSVNGLDYAVIGIYLLITLGVGFYFVKFNQGASDFFKGGNKIPWLVAGLSAFMSGFSAWTFTGAAGVAYQDGFAIIYMYLGNTVSFLAGYFWFATRWRRSRISTNMEYLSERFDSTTRQSFSWTTVIFQICMAGSMLYGMCIFISGICNVPIQMTIIIAGIVIMAYCFLGGLWAVVMTDFIQGTILIPFTMVLAGAALYKVGGLNAFISGLPAEMKTMSDHSDKGWAYVACWTVMVTFGYNTAAHAQRYYSVDCEKSGKKIALLNVALFALGSFIWFIPPIAVRLFLPDLGTIEMYAGENSHERSYVAACAALLPNGLLGIMLAAMFSAGMSSLSSYYNLHAAIITKDIFPKLIGKELSEKQNLYVGRIATFGVGTLVAIIAYVMASRQDSVFDSMLKFNTVISLAYGPPALLGLISKRTPRWSGLVSFGITIVLGSIMAFTPAFKSFEIGLKEEAIIMTPVAIMAFYLSGCFTFHSGRGNGALSHRFVAFLVISLPVAVYLFLVGKCIYNWGQQELLITILPSCGMALLISLVFGQDSQSDTDRRDAFFSKLATPIDLESEVGETSDIGSIVFMFLAKVTAVLALMTYLFLFSREIREQATIVIAYASLTLAMAGAFLVMSRFLKASVKK